MLRADLPRKILMPKVARWRYSASSFFILILPAAKIVSKMEMLVQRLHKHLSLCGTIVVEAVTKLLLPHMLSAPIF